MEKQRLLIVFLFVSSYALDVDVRVHTEGILSQVDEKFPSFTIDVDSTYSRL